MLFKLLQEKVITIIFRLVLVPRRYFKSTIKFLFQNRLGNQYHTQGKLTKLLRPTFPKRCLADNSESIGYLWRSAKSKTDVLLSLSTFRCLRERFTIEYSMVFDFIFKFFFSKKFIAMSARH